MKPCWRDFGLTEAGAGMADSVLPEVQALLDRFNGEIIKLALQEAMFRKYTLPLRTVEYRRKYLKDNE